MTNVEEITTIPLTTGTLHPSVLKARCHKRVNSGPKIIYPRGQIRRGKAKPPKRTEADCKCKTN